MSIGLVLDIDGTLIDGNEARAQAWVEALREHGHRDVSFSEVRRLVGKTAHELLLETIGFGEDTELGAAIRLRYHKNFHNRYLPRLMPFLRAPELLYRLRTAGTRIVVVSTDLPEDLALLLDMLHARPLIKHAVVPGNNPKLRSMRDLIRAALEKLGSGTNVMLADAPHDIEAADRCGLPVIALASGGFSASELSGAAEVYADAASLYADFARSPFAISTAPPAART